MKIDESLQASALAPALQRFWALSGAKIDLILKEYDPAKGSPVFTAAGKYTSRGWTEWTQGFQYGIGLPAVRRHRRRNASPSAVRS
jgi:unsaturated chondroitin disaccharide hydrolase